MNMNCGTRLGRQRRPFLIMEHLDAQGVTQRQVAAKAGVNVSLVQRTIRGNANNRKVLRALFDLGVPSTALALPPELGGSRAA